MYELKLVFIRRCRATSIDHQNIPSYTKWLYHGDIVNLHRVVERFDGRTSSNPFDEGTSSNPIDEGTSSNSFDE